MDKKQNQQFLQYKLIDVLKYAEMLSYSSNQIIKSVISEEIIPSLYTYKTFLDLGNIKFSEVDSALQLSIKAAFKIEHINKETAFLLSKIRILKEETLRIKRSSN